MNDIVKSEKQELITADKISEYMTVFGIGAGLNDNEKKQFIEVATAYQLNPFKREIYCAPYMTSVKNDKGEWTKVKKLSIITGYEVYLKRAERSGDLNGWNIEVIEGKSAKITIHRKSWNNPLIHDVLLAEYKEDNKMWKEKPMTMLKKVAMAQGFRLAFPDDLGGMPYTAEELPDNMTAQEPAKIEAPAEAEQPKADVTPPALKNTEGEIEIPKGNHKAAVERLNKLTNETQIQAFLKKRALSTWTEDELKAQDSIISALRIQWKAEADAAANAKK